MIFHRSLSTNGEATVFFFKSLSKALGGHPFSFQAEKVILLEKHSALYIFGYYSGKQCSRVGYFLSYTAYALSCGEFLDPLRLEGYGKHKLIRDRKPSLVALPDRIEEEQATQQMTLISLKKKKSPI